MLHHWKPVLEKEGMQNLLATIREHNCLAFKDNLLFYFLQDKFVVHFLSYMYLSY